ncbi:MAG: hypothetical protein R3Y24_08115 [Eubacteriales bacterium]
MKNRMSGKERLKAALLGEEVDRIPLWLREGFEYGEDIKEDDFTANWKCDVAYKELVKELFQIADFFEDVSIYPDNRYLLIPDKYIERSKCIYTSKNSMEYNTIIHTPTGDLNAKTEYRRGGNRQVGQKNTLLNL